MGANVSKPQTKKPSPEAPATSEVGPAAVGPESVGAAAVIYPPLDHPPTNDRKSIFIAGAIDQNTAPNWQKEAIKSLCDLPLDIYNPRRRDWNPGWEQKASFPPFREQVEWELGMLEKVDLILLFLPSSSKGPISLLELGLFAPSGKLIVGCGSEFWRHGNVQIVCERYNVPLLENMEELLKMVKKRLLGEIAAPEPYSKPVGAK